MIDRFAALAAFCRVVERGGFTAAADALEVTTATVSKHVAALEEHLGARLLYRTTRRVTPTEVGEAFYERCRRLLDDLEEAEAAVRALHETPRGTLRVNAPMSLGLVRLAPLFAEFQRRHAAVELDVTFTDARVDLLEEGVDVVIRVVARLDDTSHVARRIATLPVVVCASPAYLERAGTPRRPEDLADHDCVVYTLAATPGRWQFRGPGGPRSVRVRGRLRANNSVVLREAALAGLGVLRAPAFVVEDALADGRLCPILDEFSPEPLSLYALYPATRHLSAKVRAFVDFLVERLG